MSVHKISRTNELMYYVTTVAKSPCNTVLITVLPGALFLFRSNYFYKYSVLFLSDNNLIPVSYTHLDVYKRQDSLRIHPFCRYSIAGFILPFTGLFPLYMYSLSSFHPFARVTVVFTFFPANFA